MNPSVLVLPLHERLSLIRSPEKCPESVVFTSDGINDEQAASIAETLKISKSIVRLHLDRNSIKDKGAKQLGDALKSNTSIQYLNISGNQISFEGAKDIFRGLKVNCSLTSLIFNLNQIVSEEADPKNYREFWVSLQFNKTLHTLSLADNRLTDHTMLALCKGLATNRSLTSLNFSGNAITGQGFLPSLLEAFASPTLTSLNLGHNPWTPEAMTTFSKLLSSNPSITDFKLSHLPSLSLVGSEYTQFIQDLQTNTSLLKLQLSDTPFSMITCELVANTKTLTKLGLQRTLIRNEELIALSKAIALNSSIKELDLSDILARQDAIQTFCQVIKAHTTLEHLNFSNNFIGEAAGEMADTIRKNKSLRTLILDGSKELTRVGKKHLLYSLAANSPLTTFSMCDVPIEADLAKEVPKALKANMHLEEFKLKRNTIDWSKQPADSVDTLISTFVSSPSLVSLDVDCPDPSGKLLTKILENRSLTEFPSSLTRMPLLQILNLANNFLPSVPNSISNLVELKELDLSNNRLLTLPPSLGFLSNLRNFKYNGNPFKTPPPEILSKNNFKLVLGFLRDLAKGAEGVYRIKLMMVGQENVGKTTLLRHIKRRRLRRPPKKAPIKPTISTDGIDIDEWQLEVPLEDDNYTLTTSTASSNLPPVSASSLMNSIAHSNGGSVGASSAPGNTSQSNTPTGATPNVRTLTRGASTTFNPQRASTGGDEGRQVTVSSWDFAGQEIYYTTHQFFLSQRSLYLLVWDLRFDDDECKVSYWLQSIRSRTKDSPVIIVGTHADEFGSPEEAANKAEKVRKKYQKRFPFVKYSLAVSCKNDNDINGLVTKIRDVIRVQDHMGELIPKTYLELERLVREECQAIKEKQAPYPPIRSWAEIQKLASYCHIYDDDELRRCVHLLHDFGSLIYFDDPSLGVENLVIVDAQFLTNVMATIITTKTSIRDGLLPHSLLPMIWRPPEFPPGIHDLLLSLLKKFEIAFTLPQNLRAKFEMRNPGRHNSTSAPVRKSTSTAPIDPPSTNPNLTVSAFSQGSNSAPSSQHLTPIGNALLHNTSTGTLRTASLPSAIPPPVPLLHPSTSTGAVHLPLISVGAMPKLALPPPPPILNVGNPGALTPMAPLIPPPVPILLPPVSLSNHTNSVDHPHSSINQSPNAINNPSIPTNNVLPTPTLLVAPITANSFNSTPLVSSSSNTSLQAAVSSSQTQSHTPPGNTPASSQPSSARDPPSVALTASTSSSASISEFIDEKDIKETLIPSLLPEERPDVELMWRAFDPTKTQYDRRYQLEFIPKGFFSRLMIRILHHVESVMVYWRNGLIAEVGKDTFLVELRPHESVLVVSVRGPRSTPPTETFRMCVETVDMLIGLNNWFNIKVTKFVPCSHCIELQKEEREVWLFPLQILEEKAVSGNWVVECEANPNDKKSIHLTTLVPDMALTDLERSKINFEDVVTIAEVGKGAFGVIYRGTYQGKEVAIKVMRGADTDGAKQKAFNEFRREAHVMSGMVHPNLVHMIGFTINPFSLVMEFLPCGNLYKFLHNESYSLDWPLRMKFALDIAFGMQYLHSATPPFIHRDLKSPNVLLLSTDFRAPVCAKVGDFGLSSRMYVPAFKEKSMNRDVGNPTWLAPEIVREEEFRESSDVYSFGIILWELFTRKHPYGEYPFQFMFELEDLIKNGVRPSMPEDCPTEYATLYRQCVSDDPDARPSFYDIIKLIVSIASDVAPELHIPEDLFSKIGAPIAATDASDSESDITYSGQFIKQLSTQPVSKIYSMVLAGNNQIWCGTRDGSILIWNTKNGHLLARHESIHKSAITSLFLAGQYIWTHAWGENARIWKTLAPETVQEMMGKKDPSTEGWLTHKTTGLTKKLKRRWCSLNSKRFYIYKAEGDKVPITMLELDGLKVTIDAKSKTPSFSLQPKNQREKPILIQAKDRQEVLDWTSAIESEIARQETQFEISHVADIEATDVKCFKVIDELVWAGTVDMRLKAWDIDSFQLSKNIHIDLASHVPPDAGTSLFINNICEYDNRLWLGAQKFLVCLDKASLLVTRCLSSHTQTINSVIGYDGKVWTCSDDCTIRVWDCFSYDCLQTFSEIGGKQFAMVRVGTQVWAAGWDGVIRVFNAKTVQLQRALELKHQDAITSFAHSYGSVWAGSWDGTVSIWT